MNSAASAAPSSASRSQPPSWSLRVAKLLVPLAARYFAWRQTAPVSQPESSRPRRILILRRNRMGDMLCAYPLIRAIRLANPVATIHIACDKTALPIAEACPHADGVILLRPGVHRWHMAFRNAAQLQGYDVAIAVKGGFDVVLASLLRLTNAPVRIGFQPKDSEPGDNSNASAFYTHPVPPPPWGEHQMETCLRLLSPPLRQSPASDLLDIPEAIRSSAPRIPDPIRGWAAGQVTRIVPAKISIAALAADSSALPVRLPLALINISSTAPLKWKDAQFQQLAKRLVSDISPSHSVAFVFAPADAARAEAIVAEVDNCAVTALATPTPLHLAAVLQHAAFLFSPEGGAGHLASFTGTPLLLLWSEGPYEKWHPRAEKLHVFRADLAHPQHITVDEVLAAIVEKQFAPPQPVTSEIHP